MINRFPFFKDEISIFYQKVFSRFGNIGHPRF